MIDLYEKNVGLHTNEKSDKVEHIQRRSILLIRIY